MNIFRIGFRAMASDNEVVLAAADEAGAQTAARHAIAEVQRIEYKYSRYRADSIVSRLNAAAGLGPVACDAETLGLLAYAATLHQASDGLFDITAGVLRRAWNFKEPRVPSAAELAPLLALIGWPRVQRDGDRVMLPLPGMEIDFGGFGKEYAADRAAAALAQQGVVHGYVNLAGDLNVLGPRPDGRPWTIAIRHPRQAGQVVATLPVHRGGLATSGDYERAFDLDGRRWCHVLDPSSGMPVTHWQSVSVLAANATAAGSAATLTMLMQAQGLHFLHSSGLDFLAIDHQGELHMPAEPLQSAQHAVNDRQTVG
ncbi:MAG: FAD:protein FMN transferase [Rubrivivax sp.]|nr:FAD:protein FMN transferase [Rubrivivax sp.]